jgi:hypothetical protein
MQVTEFRFVVLDDPLIAVLSIVGVAGLLAGAILRARGTRRVAASRALMLGLLGIAAAIVYTLVGSWLSLPR